MIKKTPANYLNQFLPMFALVALIACNNRQSETTSEKNSLPKEKNKVDAIVLESGNFSKEIISNGKLAAVQKAELYFKTQGIIGEVNLRNGERVQAGKDIACLNTEELQYALKKAELAFEQAKIDRKDKLLGMGYTSENLGNIPPEHLKIAEIRSGYQQAELAFDEARRQLNFACIKAPFGGLVEGISQKPFEKADLGNPFCSVINNEIFYVEFPLLETEINKAVVGQETAIIPVAGGEKSLGKITEINPRIDENGLAWLKAEVKNPGDFMEGMNVKVSIKETVPGQLIVPKSAVVLRQDREVLFRYTGGIAYWTYIQVLDENNDSYSVRAAEGATLNPGDTVIISNNLNLAHESEVEVEEVKE